jgi:hypothetical protein
MDEVYLSSDEIIRLIHENPDCGEHLIHQYGDFDTVHLYDYKDIGIRINIVATTKTCNPKKMEVLTQLFKSDGSLTLIQNMLNSKRDYDIINISSKFISQEIKNFIYNNMSADKLIARCNKYCNVLNTYYSLN